ncbi:AAA domain-containing protein, partial [Luteibacter sp.]|uniref:AAA domain-containing protein n=1 Tax=Luteibacter sp. TaxID=1886636 RepID=UPI003F7E5FFD
RRRPARERARHAGWLPPFSYAQDDYRPLGRALFEQWVRPSELPQRTEAGASPSKEVRRPTMVDTVAEAPPADVESYSLEESDGHRYAWDLDLTQVTLANFNYRKMSLVRDYAQLIDDGTVNPAFDKVFSIEPRELETELPAPLPFAEQWSVVPSDATQNAAVGVARSQRSFIIQGPPGTGKSQTITNLIADYAGRGKRVLFVCEKRAALDVVFHRLKQSGLDALCCLIHDSQADKKGFITDLKAGYESWMATAHESDALATRRRVLVEALDKATRRIEGFEEAMTATPSELGVTVRSLLRRVASRPPPPAAGAARGEGVPAGATWDRYHELAQRVHRAMWERFGCEGMAGHALARLAAPLVADARAFGRAEQLCGDAEALLAQLDPLLESTATLIDADMSLPVALAIAIESQWLLDTGLVAHLALLDPTSTAHAALRQIQAHAATCQDELERARADTVHWRDKLSPGDTESAFSMVQALEGSVARWFQPSWWRLRGELKRRYDFGKHAVRPGFAKILSQLGREHAAVAALEAAEAEGRKLYGVTDLAAFLSALHTLQQRAGSADAGHHALLAHLRRAIDPVAAARAEADGRAPLEKLADRVQDNLASADEATPGQLAEWVRDLREALDDLPDLLPLLRAVHTAEPAFADLLAHVNASPVELEALVSDEALLRLERLDPVVASFGGAALAQAARLMATAQRELLALNAQVICASRHQQFAANVHRSALAASQLDGEGKAFKKNYATGRRELEHEFGKSMRYRSIRDLADDETGMVINDLKPIWLMSPLSVSDTLPLSKDLFDVVIFDEASQIPTEEAVPALSRARQVVVVGDEMQLPPTSFFSASGAEGDDEVLVEDDGEKIAISLDADSLLNQAGRNLPATLLAWHYRSRHESLISFSNAAFYDGRLVTIPDRAMELAVEQPASIRSNAVDAGIEGAEALLARPISFHRLADGVYVERRNQPEAQYIAQVVREMLRRETGMSIGIVAFSEAQQGAIETALEALGTEDADFATRLEREYVREDDDQFNGLFVKNLENVQGDERDIIILSICYAPGPEGKMLMNFGPINQRGGEKRLNVIFSRARHRMAVVSTIQADAITNVHNDGAAALRTFLQFAQASATGQFERAQATLAALNRGARDTFARVAGNDSIRDQLAKALRNRGHIVSENVGRSQFRCDLAIAEPSGQGYALAILLDAPDAPVVDTVERYVFRPGVLRQFGWHVLDIPGKDWIDDQEAVIARIEGMLADGEDRALDALIDILPDIDTAPAEAGPGEEPSAEPTSDAVSPVSLRSLRFEQGTSRKFWRAQVDGLQFTVTFGRIGTQGQAQVKVFETAQRAHREMEKLVAEKLRKGYVDD